jgi:O-antigen ligase
MLGVVYFFWEVRRHWSEFKWRNLHMLYLLMAIYLLKGGPGGFSMTSISVCAFAIIVFLRIQSLRNRTSAVRPFFLAVFSGLVVFISFVLIHSVVMFSPESIFGRLITLFGRDITLTDRTFIWSDVYAAASNSPLIGVGFGGFWIGRLANIPWNAHMTWVLGQAHSGYVDVYLQLGILGAMLFAVVMFTTPSRLLASLEENFEFGCFRITMFLTIAYVNITESSYLRGDHHLWLIMQMVMWTVPGSPPALQDPGAGEENSSSAFQLDAAAGSFDSAAAIPVANHEDPSSSDQAQRSSTSP